VQIAQTPVTASGLARRQPAEGDSAIARYDAVTAEEILAKLAGLS
jgi:hypothetical protein